jgi:hypothetical protein
MSFAPMLGQQQFICYVRCSNSDLALLLLPPHSKAREINTTSKSEKMELIQRSRKTTRMVIASSYLICSSLSSKFLGSRRSRRGCNDFIMRISNFLIIALFALLFSDIIEATNMQPNRNAFNNFAFL